MLVKIEARILIFPGTDFHFPSTSVPPGTFLGSAVRLSVCLSVCPGYHPLQQRAVGLLLCARHAGDIDRLLHIASEDH